MMTLGIDYGRKRVGIALSEGMLAEPLGVVNVSSVEDAACKIKDYLSRQKAERVVLGIVEGELKSEIEHLGEILKKSGVAVCFFDETLTSVSALKQLISSGKSKKKRSRLDAAAAAVILQSFLDSEER